MKWIKNIIRISIVVLLVVLSILAIGGGWMLINDPSGESIQIPIDLLSNTPFNDYLVPGVILFIFVGILSFFTAFLAVLKKRGFTRLVVLEGIILVGWLSIELIFNIDFYTPVLHIPLYIIGILLILFGIEFKKIERKEE